MKKEGFLIGNVKGQVTVFIIAAVLIVGLAVVIYLIRPGTEARVSFDETNPKGFIQTCIQERVAQTIADISAHGGSVDPDHSVLYKDEEIEYLCYTSENYGLCNNQRPFLHEHIESEIKNAILEDTANCFAELRRSYEGRGYDAALEGDINKTEVDLLPKRILISFDYILTASKTEDERYEDFNVVLNNNLYELAGIANNIVDFESEDGDAETGLYMTMYPELKVEKIIRDDGTTIYILTDRELGTKFQFASRSAVWPSGFGYTGVASN